MPNRAFLLAMFFLVTATIAEAAERRIVFSDDRIPDAGTLVLAINTEGPISPAHASIDEHVGGLMSKALSGEPMSAGETRSLFAAGPYREITLLAYSPVSERRVLLEDLGGRVAQLAAESDAADVTLIWDDPAGSPEDGAQLAFGAALGQYRFDRYKSEQDPHPPAESTLTIAVMDAADAESRFNARWQPVAEAVRFTRNLISEPANVIYPESFVERTAQAFKGIDDVSVRVLDESEIQSMGMGALAGVGQGSARPPRLIAVHFRGGKRGDAPLAFVGKGITFDTGGISLKDGNTVWKMKYDMAGAAAAIGSVLALAKRGAEVNVVGIAALAENMPSANAQRPGDVVTTGSGKTIEIISTDAEGRLVLADGVWFAQKEYQPAVIIDLATLTGSVSVALGDEYAGAFSRDATLVHGLIAAGNASGEMLWHLPLHESYAKDIQSDIADIKNISGHRKAGAGVGAQVIGTFVEDTQPWVHLDIAGMAWKDEGTATVPKGAVGFGVRLLDSWAEQFTRN